MKNFKSNKVLYLQALSIVERRWSIFNQNCLSPRQRAGLINKKIIIPVALLTSGFYCVFLIKPLQKGIASSVDFGSIGDHGSLELFGTLHHSDKTPLL